MAGRFISKDQQLMRELWRRAFRERGLEVRFASEAHAHRARMMLYNSVKLEKKGNGEDPELMAAAESVEIVFGQTKAVLVLRMREDNPIFQAMGEALGQSIETVVAPDAAASYEKLMRELGELGGADSKSDKPALDESTGLAVEHKPTPFYDRSKG